MLGVRGHTNTTTSRDMCVGKLVTRGNTYHCNTGIELSCFDFIITNRVVF